MALRGIPVIPVDRFSSVSTSYHWVEWGRPGVNRFGWWPPEADA